MLQPLEPGEKHPHFQSLINIAYDRWQDGDLKDMRYREFVDELDDISQIAVAFKNLNYQVGNGGFSQWHGNDYSDDAEIILNALDEHIVTDAGSKVRQIIDEAWEENIDFFDGLKEAYDKAARYDNSGRLNDFQNTFADMCDEKMHDDLNRLDDRYYKLSDQLLDDIESWFSTTDEGRAALARVELVAIFAEEEKEASGG